VAGTPTWTLPPPAVSWGPQAQPRAPIPPQLAGWQGADWNVPHHYRWRPLPGARPLPPPRVWRQGYAPPRLSPWRGAGPMVVAVDGRAYRFRPVFPQRPPAVAYAPPPRAWWFAPRHPGWPSRPPTVAARPWLPAPGAWAAGPPYRGPSWQSSAWPLQTGVVVYRFRPDLRFPGRDAVYAMSDPGPGPGPAGSVTHCPGDASAAGMGGAAGPQGPRHTSVDAYN